MVGGVGFSAQGIRGRGFGSRKFRIKFRVLEVGRLGFGARGLGA